MLEFEAWVKSCGGSNEAAKRLGVSSRVIRMWIAGDRRPRWKNLKLISRKSKISLEKLFAYYI